MEEIFNILKLMALKKSFDFLPPKPKEIQMRPDFYKKFCDKFPSIATNGHILFNELSFNPLAGIPIVVNENLKGEFEIIHGDMEE